MRYTRKDISGLSGTVMLGSTWVLTVSEDGASTSITEDIGHVAC